MKRWLAVSLLLALPAAAQSWREKLDAFRTAASAERKKLGLDRDRKALFAKYPTPEVTFGKDADARVVLCPGETKSVAVSGKVQPGSLVVLASEDVEFLKEGPSAKGWEATVRVKKSAPPGMVDLEIVAPVSAAQSSARGLFIGCDHTWTLEVGSDTLVVKSHLQREAGATAPGEWKRAGKPLGTANYVLTPSSGRLALELVQTQDDAMAQMKAFQEMMKSPEMKALDARTAAAVKKLEGCGKLAPPKRGACFEAPQQELDQIQQAREALQAQAELEAGPAFGCRRLDVAAKDGTATGEAEGCAGRREQDQVKITGRYTSP